MAAPPTFRATLTRTGIAAVLARNAWREWWRAGAWRGALNRRRPPIEEQPQQKAS